MMKLEIANFVFLIILIDAPLRKCDSDFDNARDKRTVGVFFRSFVDAFQTQRQPAPNVVSFKPPRQTFPQSLKSDIFSSSKTIFQQKQNLLKPSTTKAPDTEVIITKPPPAPSPPSAPAEPISKDPKNQTEEFPLSLPQLPPIDPFANFLPPPGQQHPFTPFKAQILVHPFQGHQGSETPFPGFGHHLFGGVSPFNYQADIYLHPPSSGAFPTGGQHKGRYSPDNGWHDVDEILSKGIQAPPDKNVEKEKIKDESSAKLKDVELNKYEANIESQTVDIKLSDHPEAKAPLPGGGYGEFGVEGLRRDSHLESYQNGFYNSFPNPIFLQQFPTDSNFGLDPSGNIYGDSLNNFNFNNPNQGFKQLKDEDCKTVTPDGSKNAVTQPTTEVPQDRVRVTDTGLIQWRSDPTQTGHDFTPLRGVTGETKEKPQQESYEHLPDYGLFPFPGYGADYQHQPEQSHYYSEPDYYYDNYNDNNYAQHYQHRTKIGELPNNYQKPHNHYEHPPPSPHDPHIDETEISDSHPNGYYHFKRSYIAKRHY